MTIRGNRRSGKFAGHQRQPVGQRLMLAGVPKSAREMLAWLDRKPDAEPGYAERFEMIAREFCPYDPDKLTRFSFGLFHNPNRDVAGVVFVVTPAGLLLLDAGDGRMFVRFLWTQLCRFDVKHDGDFQIVGFAWYDGTPKVEERVARGIPLTASEVSGGFMYLHAHPEILTAVAIGRDVLGVPETVHGLPYLL